VKIAIIATPRRRATSAVNEESESTPSVGENLTGSRDPDPPGIMSKRKILG